MSFVSWEYVLLLPAVALLCFTLPPAFRNPVLLAASLLFYMAWRPEYVLLVLATVAVDYAVGLGLARTERPGLRRLLLGASLASNLGLLFFFKYFAFAADVLRNLCGAAGVPVTPPEFDLVLPLGISFYVFQALSYTIDVYRREIPAQRGFSRLLLYVLFFPQLVAGPIERASSLLPQFAEVHAFDRERIVSGLRLVLWGVFKKAAVADRLALLVDPVYAAPDSQPGALLVLATYAFAFQIYADFSGYSDIAVGSARILGFRLMENFRQPYFATSIRDFWRRWHVSLSTWFRDYVYVPLGGNRTTPRRAGAALAATFLLSGLWHGARWTFVLWGAYHALLMLVERALGGAGRPPVSRGSAFLRSLLVFHLVLAGWVLFRADSLTDAVLVFRGALDADFLDPLQGRVPALDVLLGAAGVLVLLAGDALAARGRATPAAWPLGIRWALYAAGVLAALNGRPDREITFIYFQF